MELAEEQLGLRYQSFCDPRLNFEQSLGMFFFFFLPLFTLTHDPRRGFSDRQLSQEATPWRIVHRWGYVCRVRRCRLEQGLNPYMSILYIYIQL